MKSERVYWGKNFHPQSFVYLIKNQISGDTYVGQTSWGQKRVTQHFRLSRTNPSKGNKNFYNSINTYGEENFIWGVLEEVPPSLLKERETFWINKLKPTYNKLPQFWLVQFPTGEVETITNFLSFCEEHSLQPPGLWGTLKGTRKQEKGFRLLPRTEEERRNLEETRRKKLEGHKVRTKNSLSTKGYQL